MGRFADIISSGSQGDNIRSSWDTTKAAGEFACLPPGKYVARIISGELKKSKSNSTPGYSMTFEVIEPVEHKGRKFWHDCWLTPGAMPQSKRDLGKLGVTSLDQLENALPKYLHCECKLALRKDDSGNETNRLKSFDKVVFVKQEEDPYATEESNEVADSSDDEKLPPTAELEEAPF